MNDRIKEIRARLEQATPGPWRWMNCITLVADYGSRRVVLVGGNDLETANAEGLLELCSIDGSNEQLIANAPTDLAWLIARVEKLEAQRDEWIKRAESRDLSHYTKESERAKVEIEIEMANKKLESDGEG